MPRTYVDNAYNRRVGRVGMPVGSFVISRDGTYLGSQEYVYNYKNRSLGRVGLPRGSYPEGCSSWDILSDKVVTPTYTQIHPDTNGRDKGQHAKEVTYETKAKEAHSKKTDKADNIHKDGIKTKEKLTNLEILLDDNERLQMKVLEEQEKVAVLEEERTNLRRKLDEKEKIIQITEEAKDSFRSRLDEAENNLAKKEEDFKLIKNRFENMCKYEKRMARANLCKQMLDDQLIQLTHRIQQQRLYKDKNLTFSDEITNLQARVAERDDEICKLKEFIQKQEDTIKVLNRKCLEETELSQKLEDTIKELNKQYLVEKELSQKLEDTIKALNKKYLVEKGTLKTKTRAHTRQLARYRQKMQEDVDTKVKLYKEMTNQQTHVKPDRDEECTSTELNPDKKYFVLSLKKRNQEDERLKQEAL